MTQGAPPGVNPSSRQQKISWTFYFRSLTFPSLSVPSLLTEQFEPPETQKFGCRVKRWQVDQSGCCPVLQSCINVDWLTSQMFAPLFPRLYEGILHDVFMQKAAVTRDNAPSSRIMVSRLLPGPMEAPSMLQDFHTKCYTGASFSTSEQKSLVGLRISTRDQMYTGSGDNGNVVKHGLLRKLLLLRSSTRQQHVAPYRDFTSYSCDDGWKWHMLPHHLLRA